MTLTCIGQGTVQRWRIKNEGGGLVTEKVFTRGSNSSIANTTSGLFQFTLISTAYYHFESLLSTVVTTALNNTIAECTDTRSIPRGSAVIKIAGI